MRIIEVRLSVTRLTLNGNSAGKIVLSSSTEYLDHRQDVSQRTLQPRPVIHLRTHLVFAGPETARKPSYDADSRLTGSRDVKRKNFSSSNV